MIIAVGGIRKPTEIVVQMRAIQVLVKNFNKDTYFVAKKEVIENKLFGKLLSSFGGIPIDRENVDIRSLMNIIKILKSGCFLF